MTHHERAFCILSYQARIENALALAPGAYEEALIGLRDDAIVLGQVEMWDAAFEAVCPNVQDSVTRAVERARGAEAVAFTPDHDLRVLLAYNPYTMDKDDLIRLAHALRRQALPGEQGAQEGGAA